MLRTENSLGSLEVWDAGAESRLPEAQPDQRGTQHHGKTQNMDDSHISLETQMPPPLPTTSHP